MGWEVGGGEEGGSGGAPAQRQVGELDAFRMLPGFPKSTGFVGLMTFVEDFVFVFSFSNQPSLNRAGQSFEQRHERYSQCKGERKEHNVSSALLWTS